MIMTTECPDRRQLRALSLGETEDDRSRELFAHVEECRLCQSELETIDEPDSLIVSLREPNDLGAYREEPHCQHAVIRALGALAEAESAEIGEASVELPQQIGEYQVVRRLGRGGMGAVYLARHTKLGREVALKILARHRLGDTGAVERFEAEMRAVGRLSHPNIVTAHDAREVDGTAMLITEYIEGLDLGQVVKRIGPLSVADACEVVRQVALALEYVGREGFVHRDVKPSNIMLGRDGQVKLLDLGLARLQDVEGERNEMTGTGQTLGTADFVAPEQVADSRAVDIRADVYSLGCTLFKLLTGRAPFESACHATAFAKLTAHVQSPAPSLQQTLPGVPAKLSRLVEEMLAKDPVRRPATPLEAARRLASFTAGNDLPTLVREAGAREPTELVRDAGDSTPRSAAPTSWLRRSYPVSVLVAVGVFGWILGLAFGLIIRITHPDGTTITHRLPDGANVEMFDSGKPSADPSSLGSRDSASPPAPNGTALEDKPLPDALPNPTAAVAEPGATPVPAQLVEQSSRMMERIQGAWKLTRISLGGEELPPKDLPFSEIVIQQNKFRVNLQGAYLRAILRYSPDQGGTIDSVSSTYDGTQKGRWRLAAPDRLQFCFGLQPSDPRPETFGVHPERSVMTYERVNQTQRIESMPMFFAILKHPESVHYSAEGEPLNGVWCEVSDRGKLGSLAGHVRRAPNGSSYVFIDPAPDALITWTEIEGNLKCSRREEEHGAALDMELGDELSRQLAKLTEANIGKYLAVGVRGKIVSAPRLLTKISGKARLSGVSDEVIRYLTDATQKHDRQEHAIVNLKKLGLAMLNHESVYGNFPASAGKLVERPTSHPVSWRVAILPYLGFPELFERYDCSVPWDHEKNRAVLAEMPEVFRSPFASNEQFDGLTNYVVFTGKGAFRRDDVTTLPSFTDGTSNTLMVVETAKSVPWTKPDDLDFRVAEDAKQLAPLGDKIRFVAADGAVYQWPTDQWEELAKWITHEGGERVDRSVFQRGAP